jgi:hypothetical protein
VRLNYPKLVEREVLLKYLTEGICQISFTKVKDNTNRVLYCTLEPGLVPAQYTRTIEKLLSDTTMDRDLIPVWDVVDGKWKSFKISKLIYFLTSDELVKENITGYNVVSNNTKTLKDRRDDAVNKQREKAKSLREQSQKNNDIINGETNED